MTHSELLALLLPSSYAPDAGLLAALLAADGAALDAAYGSARALQDEMDPRTTADMFIAWEVMAGLPDACIGADQSTGQRRTALVAKWVGQGGQSPAYFVGLAAAMGYAITITEYVAHTVIDTVAAPILGTPWRLAWQVNAQLNTVWTATVNDTVSDPISSWGNAALECMVNRLKPAHTVAIFSYT